MKLITRYKVGVSIPIWGEGRTAQQKKEIIKKRTSKVKVNMSQEPDLPGYIFFFNPFCFGCHLVFLAN